MNYRNRILLAMPEDDFTALLPGMVEVTLIQGEVLYREGERVDHAYFPNNAVLSVVATMRDGRTVESGTVGCEGAVGILPSFSGKPPANRVFAQIGGNAVRLKSANLFERAAASSGLLRLLGHALQAGAEQAEQSVACNALHSVTQRMARWLLTTQDRVGGPMLNLTQQYLSVMLGVQRTTVNAAAGNLRDAGVIRYSRGRLQILDRPRLEALACECYAVSDAGYRRLEAVHAAPSL